MPALHDIVQKGATDRSVVVHIMDSTDGTPETGVVFNTAGIDLWYRREGAVRTAITEVTLAALTTAHADGGFLHVSDGDYRLDLPDAAFATGANYVDFGGTVTGMIVVGGRVRLVDFNLEVNFSTNAAPGASGGLLISGSNAGTTTLGALTVTGATTLTGNVAAAAGVTITQSTTNGHGIVTTGNGTGAGLRVVGGATGVGLNAVGGGTSGDAILTSATSGHGIVAAGSGTTKHGIHATGGTTTSHGINAVGGGVGHGILATSGTGATGDGIRGTAASTNGNGVNAVGVGTGAGVLATGGTTGHGVSGVGGATSGNGVRATGTAGNSAAMNLIGQGSAAGLLSTGGATGQGVSMVGGATSGLGLGISYTAPIGPCAELGILESGTLQSATATTAVLRSATAFADDIVNAATLAITGGTGSGQQRLITDWVSATDTATVDTWVVTPDNTSLYEVYRTAPGGTVTTPPTASAIADEVQTRTIAAVTVVNGLAANTITAAATAADFGTEVGTAVWATTTRQLTGTQAFNVTGDITGNLSGTVGSVTGAVASVTGAVGSVTGLTASDLGAIKAKTDSLTFTKANEIDANVHSLNGVTLIGDGETGTEFSV
jgi:hypothetical protein